MSRIDVPMAIGSIFSISPIISKYIYLFSMPQIQADGEPGSRGARLLRQQDQSLISLQTTPLSASASMTRTMIQSPSFAEESRRDAFTSGKMETKVKSLVEKLCRDIFDQFPPLDEGWDGTDLADHNKDRLVAALLTGFAQQMQSPNLGISRPLPSSVD